MITKLFTTVERRSEEAANSDELTPKSIAASFGWGALLGALEGAFLLGAAYTVINIIKLIALPFRKK